MARAGGTLPPPSHVTMTISAMVGSFSVRSGRQQRAEGLLDPTSVQGPAVTGDPGRELLGPLLGEQQQHLVAATLVVRHDRPHGSLDVSRCDPPLVLDVG